MENLHIAKPEMSYGLMPGGYEDELSDADEKYSEMLFDDDPQTPLENKKEYEIPFDTRLSHRLKVWIEASDTTSEGLQWLLEIYRAETSPLLAALQLFANCKNTPWEGDITQLQYHVLNTIYKLYMEEPSISDNNDPKMRMVVFYFLRSSCKQILIQNVTKVYKLKELVDEILPKISKTASEGGYESAAYWVMALELVDAFTIQEIAFPLLLQNKNRISESYLSQSHAKELEMVQFLDRLLMKGSSVYMNCCDTLEKYRYINVRHDLLSQRPLIKLLKRLTTDFATDNTYTPNVIYMQNSRCMHYWYHKYKEGTMNQESWRELVLENATNMELKTNLVVYLSDSKNLDESVYWAKYFQLPAWECPESIRRRLREQNSPVPIENECAATPHTKADGEYLTLTLPTEQIPIIDDMMTFARMLAYLKTQPLIAFDSEWKTNNSAVCLLQIASPDRVYLVDCLSSNISLKQWEFLSEYIFNNPQILKLGFSISSDMMMLQKTLPLEARDMWENGWLDLRELFIFFKKRSMLFPFDYSKKSEASLSSIVEMCLGKKLDKSNQVSNWSNRPLRREQVHYAALDSYCLLQVYDVVLQVLKDACITIGEVMTTVAKNKKSKKHRGRRSHSNKSHAAIGDRVHNVEASSINFICDNSLMELTTELRILGFDCVNMKIETQLCDCLFRAKEKNCLILTGLSRNLKMKLKPASSKHVRINSKTTIDQIIEVLHMLHLDVPPAQLFTRCLSCNDNNFLLAHPQDIMLMIEGNLVNNHLVQIPEDPAPFTRVYTLRLMSVTMLQSRRTASGAAIKYTSITAEELKTKKYILICDNCGDCYSNGCVILPDRIAQVIQFPGLQAEL